MEESHAKECKNVKPKKKDATAAQPEKPIGGLMDPRFVYQRPGTELCGTLKRFMQEREAQKARQ
jgi:hypothetical protein